MPRSFLSCEHRVFLHIGAVSQNAQVWVNGQAVGTHRGGHLPCEFEITEALAGERSALVVIQVDQVLAVTTQALVYCLQSFYDAYGKPILLIEFGADTLAGLGDIPEQAFTEGFQAELVIR